MTVDGQMQTKCWKGQHPFDREDISFEQEILADDIQKLEFLRKFIT